MQILLCRWCNQKVRNFFCNSSVGVLSRHNNIPQADAFILTEDEVDLKNQLNLSDLYTTGFQVVFLMALLPLVLIILNISYVAFAV